MVTLNGYHGNCKYSDKCQNKQGRPRSDCAVWSGSALVASFDISLLVNLFDCWNTYDRFNIWLGLPNIEGAQGNADSVLCWYIASFKRDTFIKHFCGSWVVKALQVWKTLGNWGKENTWLLLLFIGQHLMKGLHLNNIRHGAFLKRNHNINRWALTTQGQELKNISPPIFMLAGAQLRCEVLTIQIKHV